MNNKKEDFDKFNRRAGVGLLSVMGAAVPKTIYRAGLTPYMINMQLNSGEEKLNYVSDLTNKLKKSMKIKDTNIHLNTDLANKMGGAITPEYTGFMGKFVHNIEPGIHMSTKNESLLDKDMGVLSHELGHSKNMNFLKKIKLLNSYGASRMASMPVAGISSLVTGFSKDDKTARNSALIGTAAVIPMLAEEGLATARGIKGLSKMYGGLGKAITRGGGGKMLLLNSSYLAAGAVPALTYGIRKAIETSGKKNYTKHANLNQQESIMNQQQYDQIKQAAFEDEIQKIAMSDKEYNIIDKRMNKYEKKHRPALITNAASLVAGGAAGGTGGYMMSKKLFKNVKGIPGLLLRISAGSGGIGLGGIVGAAGGVTTSDLLNEVYRKGFKKDREKAWSKVPNEYLERYFNEN